MAKQAPHYSQIFSEPEINYLKELADISEKDLNLAIEQYCHIDQYLIKYIKHINKSDKYSENVLKNKIKYRKSDLSIFIKSQSFPSKNTFKETTVDLFTQNFVNINIADFNSIEIDELMALISAKVAFVYYLIYKKPFKLNLLKKRAELINIYKIETQYIKCEYLPAFNIIHNNFKLQNNKNLTKKLSFPRSRAQLVLFLLYTWDDYLKRLSHSRQIELLKELNLIAKTDAIDSEHIKKLITRLGLNKSARRKKQKIS